MSTSTSTPGAGAPPLDTPGSGHSTPASYTSSYPHPQSQTHPHPSYSHPNPTAPSITNGTSTPTSSTSIDLTNLSSHPIYTAMFPDPDLPIANISRIMKRSLPENAKIAKDAKDCVKDCVSELISFITSEASDKCTAEKRKTINGDDILYAMRVLGFDNYEEVLRVYLSRYRMDQENNPKTRKRGPNSNGTVPKDDDQDQDQDQDQDVDQEEDDLDVDTHPYTGESGHGDNDEQQNATFNSPTPLHHLTNPSH